MTKRKVKKKTSYEVGDIILAKTIVRPPDYIRKSIGHRKNPLVIRSVTVIQGHQREIHAHSAEGVQFNGEDGTDEKDDNKFIFLLSQWKLTVIGKEEK